MIKKEDVNANIEDDVSVTTGEPILEENITEKKLKKWPFPGFGIVCTLLSAFFFSSNALIVKMLDLSPFQLSLSRCSMQFLILLPLNQYKSYSSKVDILGPKNLRIFLYMRGLVGSSAMIFLYLAVDALSVGNAVTITYLSMILVPFVARIFLKESLTILDIIFGIVSLTGVVLIAQPTFLFPVPEGGKSQSGIGVVFAMGSATLQAITLVLVRKLGRETYPGLSVLYYSACGALTSTIILSALKEFRLPCKYDLPFVFSLGVLGVCGQCFLTLALQAERAGTVGVLRSVQIIFVYVLQITILGDIPTLFSLIGAMLIFSSSIGIGIRKVFNERKRRKSLVKT